MYRCHVCWSEPDDDGSLEFVCETLVTLIPLGGKGEAVYRVLVAATVGVEAGWRMTNSTNGRLYRVIEVESCGAGQIAAILGRWGQATSTSG